MRSPLLHPALLALLAVPAAATAQARNAPRDTVPLSMLPPAGKCRIWMAGVPAAQQPAPTDCATALRQKPANGVLLYGPAQRDTDADRFDPKVGQEPRTTKSTSDRANDERRNGSPAEQELERQRERAARARMLEEARERDERARREAAERAVLMGGAGSSRGSTAPSPRGTTAVPRGSTGNSTGTSTGNSTGSGNGTRTETKAPPEGKRKPE
jgi:hypothetical protein